MEHLPYNDYGSAMRRKLGGRVQKLAIDAGLSCPNRDGTIGFGGCTFCLGEAFSPAYCREATSITDKLDELRIPYIYIGDYLEADPLGKAEWVVALATLCGVEAEGKAFFAEVKEFAVKTPLQLNDIAGAAQTLLGFGISAEKIMPILRQLGDVSMGNAERFKSLSLAFAQATSAGKLQGQDLLQMINAGFNPLNEIAKKTGKSISQLKDDMSNKYPYTYIASYTLACPDEMDSEVETYCANMGIQYKKFVNMHRCVLWLFMK